MKTILPISIVASMLFFTACTNGTSENKSTGSDSSKMIRPEVTLSNVSQSPDFKDATLTIKEVKAEKAGADSAKINFSFELKNYELKNQTSDHDTKMCNNSDKGQHIHFILDNQPYKALYEPTNSVTLANGTEHYLMAFLSRSYHESIKTKGAAIVYHFKIDEKGNLKKLEDPTTPMIFYSRPKGDYIGKDTANVLFDFYVWNCELSKDGYKVISIVTRPQSDPKVDTLNKWESHFIQNLGTGDSKIALSLIDKDGKKVEGPQTSYERTIHLFAQEPLKK